MFSRMYLVVAGLALITAGCVRSTTTVAVEEDGSGQVTITVTVDAGAVLDQAGQSPLPLPDGLVPQDTAAVCARLGDAARALRLPPDATVEPFEDDDGQCGRRIGFGFTDPAQLTERFETLADREGDGPILRQEGDRWFFDAPLIRPLDLVATNEQLLVAEQLTRQQELTYEVSLPGAQAGSHNADSVDGGTFTWEIGAEDTRERLEAETDLNASAGGFPVIPVVAGIAVAVAAGATAAALTARSRRRPGAVGPEPFGSGEPGRGPVVPAPGGVATMAAPTAAATPERPLVAEPRWDPTRNAWVADHPVEGLLVHDDAAGEWRRAT